MIGASFSPAAPAQAQAQTGACVDASGHIGLDPSPITVTQLKEQGITISASGLPANALGQAVIVKEDLRTLSEIYSEYYQDERAAAVADFLKVAMSPLPAVGSQGFVDWGDEKNEHLGYFMTDAEGNMSLTFGGNEKKQQEFPIRAILDQYVADGYLSEEDIEDDADYFDELTEEVEANGWSSTLPDFEDGYEGNYSVAFLLDNFVTGDSYRYFLYDGTLFATEFESEESSQHHDRQLERLIEAGFSEDEAVYAGEGLGAAIMCTEFTVVEDSAPSESSTPEPSTSPTPEPSISPTPEPSISPTPEPSTSPTPEPSTSPTPEPSTSPTPEPSTSPTPEPSTSPTPEPNSTPSPAPSAPPSASVGSTGSLPQTGGDVYGVLTAGGILLAAGGTLVVLARRRSVTR
nr:LPXTG cell wall anchor domain-containing protein [Pseudoclavibacter sp. Marseille-Q3772]